MHVRIHMFTYIYIYTVYATVSIQEHVKTHRNVHIICTYLDSYHVYVSMHIYVCIMDIYLSIYLGIRMHKTDCALPLPCRCHLSLPSQRWNGTEIKEEFQAKRT